ncbi:hypothetical protein MKZ38_007996 [Zalerion maritima]|uniref:Uncharacterized protein n=1 Tax=Zalerion maritima TaxID=339359 RepID=A0AAD5RW98_9PEZI|nr:hypothetical protein MKZ38_007996 [Zalerion maritima]
MSFHHPSLPNWMQQSVRSLPGRGASSAFGRHWDIGESSDSDDDYNEFLPRSGPLFTISEKPEPDENQPPASPLAQRTAFASLPSHHRLSSSSSFVSKPGGGAEQLAPTPRRPNNFVPFPPGSGWSALSEPKYFSNQRSSISSSHGDDELPTWGVLVETAPLLGGDKTPSPRKLKRSSSHRTANAGRTFENLSAKINDRDSFSTSPPPISIIGIAQTNASKSGGYQLSPDLPPLTPGEDVDPSLIPLPLGAQSASSSYPTEGIRSSPSGGSDLKSPIGSIISNVSRFGHNSLDFSLFASGSGSGVALNSSDSLPGDISPVIQELCSPVSEDPADIDDGGTNLGDVQKLPSRAEGPTAAREHLQAEMGFSGLQFTRRYLMTSPPSSTRGIRHGSHSSHSSVDETVVEGQASTDTAGTPHNPSSGRPSSETYVWCRHIHLEAATRKSRSGSESPTLESQSTPVLLPSLSEKQQAQTQTQSYHRPAYSTLDSSISPRSVRNSLQGTRLSPILEVTGTEGNVATADNHSIASVTMGFKIFQRAKSNLGSLGKRFGGCWRRWMRKVCETTRVGAKREKDNIYVRARKFRLGVVFQRRVRARARMEDSVADAVRRRRRKERGSRRSRVECGGNK